jgi:outer membrane protein W
MAEDVMKKLILALLAFVCVSTSTMAQPVEVEKGMPQDSAIIFESPRPILETAEQLDARLNNGWGFGAFFTDYGFGGQLYASSRFGQDLTGLVSLDIGSAKSDKEFGFQDERKINRIMVMPLMASVQYRVLSESLGENFRPYLTAGAGPVFVMTTPGDEEFFASFGSAKLKTVPGGFGGVGANFGLDKTTTFGASVRYFFVPLPEPGIESLQGQHLKDLNGLFIGVNYGFNF